MERDAGGLRRSLGAWAAAAFVVSSMVGAGIFTAPAFVRVATGSAAAALGAWVAGAAVALCGALCYAELATRMPQAGGEYQYLARVYGPMWGFLSGWVSFFVGFAAAMAAAALGVVAYAAPLLPAAVADGSGRGGLLAALLVLVTAAFHSAGLRTSGRLQASLAGLVVAGLLAFVTLGLVGGRGDWSAFLSPTPARGSWWVAFLQVSFAYSGWNAAAYLAEEVRDARRTLPRALLGGTAVVAAVYVAMNVVLFYAIPAAGWRPEVAVGQVAAERLFGATAAAALSGLVALAIFGSLSAMTVAGPRVYYAMGRDGLAPAFLARVDPRSGSPRAAIWAQAAVATALAVTGAFEALLVYIGSALLLFSGAAVAAVIVVRRRAAAEESTAAFRVPGYPLTPLLYLGMVLLAWGHGIRERPAPTLAALATVAAGVVAWKLAERRRWIRVTAPTPTERPAATARPPTDAPDGHPATTLLTPQNPTTGARHE